MPYKRRFTAPFIHKFTTTQYEVETTRMCVCVCVCVCERERERDRERERETLKHYDVHKYLYKNFSPSPNSRF